MYIYDRPLTAPRGLGAENDVLHGLGKRPEVVSPAVQAAEVKRLKDEIIKLAQKNVWSGVDRTYKGAEKISKSMGDEAFDLLPNAGNIHFWAAEASRMLGRTLLSQTRLLRGKRSLENAVGGTEDPCLEEILGSLDAIEKTYGAVTIEPRSSKSLSKTQRKQLELRPEAMPLATDQRKSIEVAALVIKDTGSFRGLLPAGNYTLADESFTVEVGTEFRGKKPKTVRWGN